MARMMTSVAMARKPRMKPVVLPAVVQVDMNSGGGEVAVAVADADSDPELDTGIGAVF